MDMVDYFMAHNFKIWWVGAYRGMGGYWKKYSANAGVNFLYGLCPSYASYMST